MVIELTPDIVYRVKKLPSLHRARPLIVALHLPSKSFNYEIVNNSVEKDRFLEYCKKEYNDFIKYEVPSFVAMEKLVQRVDISEENKESGGELKELLIESLATILDEYGEMV